MKKFSIVLIILGLLVAAYPLAGRIYNSYMQKELIREWYDSEDAQAAEFGTGTADARTAEANYSELNDAFSEEVQNNLQQPSPGSGPQAIIKPSPKPSPENTPKPFPETTPKPSPATTPTSSPSPSQGKAPSQKVLGIIKIKKIKVDVPIIEGVKPGNLRAGIGHIPGTAALGQPGNCALAGHRSYTFGRFFNRLDELKKGDEVQIATKKNTYRYIIYEKLVVKPDDTSVIQGGKNDSIITLITCTPIYVATHRLILHARLENHT